VQPANVDNGDYRKKTIDKAKTVLSYRATVEGEPALYGRLGDWQRVSGAPLAQVK
jgi:hypothetical protein